MTHFPPGIPKEWNSWVTGATVAAAASQGAPVVLGPDASQVVLPLVTGGVVNAKENREGFYIF